jgi:DNA-binding NarL/FixJ family response regulator
MGVTPEAEMWCQHAVPPHGVRAMLPGVSIRVLIVDDQAPFRLAARFVVEATDGFEVAGEVETGEDAVRCAGELHPDLVLMDVNLPGIDGLEATRRIRADSGGGVTVLLLSTYEAEDYAAQAVECGAASFIPKSQFGPDTLAAAWEAAAAAA